MTRSAPLPAVKPKPQGGPWRTVGDCESPPLGGLAPARVISPSQAHMKYEAHGGLRKRNGVLERRASCFREGGGAGYPLEAHPERACVPEYGGGGSHSHSHSHSRIHSQPCCKIYEYRHTPEKSMFSGDALLVSALVPCVCGSWFAMRGGSRRVCAASHACSACRRNAGSLMELIASRSGTRSVCMILACRQHSATQLHMALYRWKRWIILIE